MEKKLYFAPETEVILIETSGMLAGSPLPDDQDPDIGGTGGGTPTDDPDDLA